MVWIRPIRLPKLQTILTVQFAFRNPVPPISFGMEHQWEHSRKLYGTVVGNRIRRVSSPPSLFSGVSLRLPFSSPPQRHSANPTVSEGEQSPPNSCHLAGRSLISAHPTYLFFTVSVYMLCTILAPKLSSCRYHCTSLTGQYHWCISKWLHS